MALKSSAWLGFVLSILSSILIGFDLSFNVYAIPLKETFNYTQTQVEIVASMSTIGLALSFTQRLLLNAFGQKWAFVLLWLFTPASSAIYALATQFTTFFHNHLELICIIQVILSTGMSSMYVTITSVYIEVFPIQHSGKIVGMYCAFMSIGSLVLALTSGGFFVNNLGGFFLTISISTTVIFGLCLAVSYHIYQQNITEDENKNTLVSSTTALMDTKLVNHVKKHKNASKKEAESTTNRMDSSESLLSEYGDKNKSANHNFEETATTREVLTSTYFHLLFWSSAIFLASTYTCLNDLTAMARSVGLRDPLMVVIIDSIAIFLARLISGWIFDYFLSEKCGFFILLLSHLFFVVGMALGLFQLNSLKMILLAVIVGFSQGILTIPTSLVLLRFGRKHFDSFVNALFTISGISQIIFQVISGRLYEDKIWSLGQTGIFCNGPSCYHKFFVLFVIIGSVNLIVQTFNCLHELYKGQLR